MEQDNFRPPKHDDHLLKAALTKLDMAPDHAGDLSRAVFDMEKEKKACGPLGLYLKPGTTVDVDEHCNFKVRPMTADELKADKEFREYRKSPEYKRHEEEFLKRLRSFD